MQKDYSYIFVCNTFTVVLLFESDILYFWFCLCTVCFKVFDSDHDGKLSLAELKEMLQALLLIEKCNTVPESQVPYNPLY